MKILSIVIPTFNRAGPLKATLENISEQFQSFDFSKIEVIICDNCSLDSTEAISKEWFSNTKITGGYYKNEKNFGTDRNCDLGIRRSIGKYVWLLSDDDYLEPGAIEYIFSQLKDREVNFAFINYSIITPGFDEYFPLKFDKSFNLEVDVEDLIIKTKFFFSFLSSCIFRREAWLKIDIKKYFDTYWIQLYVARDLAEIGKSLIITKPCIKMIKETLADSRANRQNLHLPINDILMNAHIHFIYFCDSFKESIYEKRFIHKVKNMAWVENRNQVLSYKLTRSKYEYDQNVKVFKELNQFFWHKPLFWLVDAPLLFFPKIFSQWYFYVMILKIKIKRYIKILILPKK